MVRTSPFSFSNPSPRRTPLCPRTLGALFCASSANRRIFYPLRFYDGHRPGLAMLASAWLSINVVMAMGGVRRQNRNPCLGEVGPNCVVHGCGGRVVPVLEGQRDGQERQRPHDLQFGRLGQFFSGTTPIIPVNHGRTSWFNPSRKNMAQCAFTVSSCRPVLERADV